MIIDTCNGNTMRDLYETFKKIHRAATVIDRSYRKKCSECKELIYFTFRLSNTLQIVHGK